MPNTKVRVKVELSNPFLRDVLPMGFETVIEPKLSTKERIIPAWKSNKWNKETLRVDTYELCPAIVVPIGNFEGYSFIGANGSRYNDKFLGSTPLDEIFTKID